MNYQTFQPHPNLATLIKCYWTLEVPYQPDAKKQLILPDGCIEMIFLLGDDIKRFTLEEKYIFQPRAMILGQINKPFYVKPTGYVNSFAVRFYPYGFANFISIPINKLVNKETPILDIFEKEAATELKKNIKNASNTQGRIKIIEDFFIHKSKEKITLDSIVKSTVDSILLAEGSIAIKSILENKLFKRRQLERKFSRIVGLSPKQFAKVIRLQATLKLLLQKNPGSLTNIAYESNYYDQAHFIKDFKEFTGVSPKDFYHNLELSLSSLMYKNE